MERAAILAAMKENNFDKSFGEVAYNAFGEAKEWKNFKGEPLQTFDGMQANFQLAWQAFAFAISNAVSVDVAWDVYYKNVTNQLTYAGVRHEWTYARLKEADPKAVAGIDAAASVVRAVMLKAAQDNMPQPPGLR